MGKSRSYLNYFYLSLLILWEPLRMVVFHVNTDSPLYIMTFVTLIANLQDRKFNRIALSKPAVIWFVWTAFAFLNMLVHGAHLDSGRPLTFYELGLFAPYLAMCLACRETEKDSSTFVWIMLLTFLLYTVIGFFFMDVVRSDIYYANNQAFSLGNSLPLAACFITFFALLLSTSKKLSNRLTIAIISFVVVVIVTTATRKALGAVAILLVFYMISRMRLKLTNIILFALAVVVIYQGLGYIMGNTVMGERLSEIEEMSYREGYTGNNFFLRLAGDRAMHYVLGWNLFFSHPLTGIGLHNFEFVTHYPVRLHTEYMVQLAENGIIGSILFLWFYTMVIKDILKMHYLVQWRQTAIICLGGIAAILFIGLTAWLYDFPRYFICIGTTMGYFLNSRMNPDNVQTSKR